MTAYEPGEQKCCDDAGWLLGPDGTPRDPAEPCKTHPEKRTPPNKKAAGKPTPGKPVTTTRQGNQDKFAWFYAMLADPKVSNAAKVVGAGCVMKMAGHKGHFKTTHKAVANLCGISQATVRRGLADLIDKRFLDADPVEGAANTYHLIVPAQRCEEWLKAEREYELETARVEREFSNWLYAEKKWRDEKTESQFRRAVLVASVGRGADLDRARQIAGSLVGKYRAEGLELDVEQGRASVAGFPDELFVTPAPAPENTASGDPESDQKRADPCSPMSRPLLTY